MNILLSVVGVLMTISSVFTYYVSENSPKTGYTSVSNAKGFLRHGVRSMQRKHLSGRNHYDLDNIVDSHFNVLKSVSYFQPSPSIHGTTREENNNPASLNTEASVKQHQKANTVPHVVQKDKKDLNNHSDQKPTKVSEIGDFQNEEKQRVNNAQSRLNPNYLNNALPRETKTNFVKVNVHKSPVLTDLQKVLRITINNNHRNNRYNVVPQPIYEPDKKLHHNNLTAAEKNMQGVSDKRTSMAQDLVAATGSHTARKAKTIEYRKGETYYDNHFEPVKDKRNLIFDNMRKYIVTKNKNINVERKGNNVYSRIGSHEDSIQFHDNPYAIFYRMHPEALHVDKREMIEPPVWLQEYSNVIPTKKRVMRKFFKRSA